MPETDPDRNRPLLERCLWRHIWIGTGSSTHAHSVRRSNASLSTTSSPREQDFQGLFDQLASQTFDFRRGPPPYPRLGGAALSPLPFWLFCFSRRPPVPWKGNPPPGEGKPTRKLHPNSSSSCGVVMLAPLLCAASPLASSLPCPRLGGPSSSCVGGVAVPLFLGVSFPAGRRATPAPATPTPRWNVNPDPNKEASHPPLGCWGFVSGPFLQPDAEEMRKRD